MSDKPVRKTAAKKTVRKTATKKAAVKKTVRKTAAKKTVRKKSATTATTRAAATSSTSTSGGRKAPTPVAEKRKASKKSKISLVLGSAVALVVFGTSVVIGTSDGGAINVNEQVNNRLENATDAERKEIQRMRNSQQQSDVPDGGLQPSSDQSVQVPVIQADTATSTATSTEASAAPTSTEAVAAETETAVATSSSRTATSSEPATAGE